MIPAATEKPTQELVITERAWNRKRTWRRFWSYPLSKWGVLGLGFLILFAFLGPLVYPVDPVQSHLSHTMMGPSLRFPLGTDGLGRNELARMMVGGQSSLEVGFAAALVAMAFGTLYGMISALSGGSVDSIMMRIVDLLLSVPSLFILLFLDAVFQPSIGLMIFIIASTSWIAVSRLVRAEVLSIKTQTYVEAALALGVGRWRTMMRYFLPNFLGTVLVATTFSVADAILTVAGLSFLGLGLPPPAPNWGEMLSSSMSYMYQDSWWLVYPPGVAILIAELAINFLGDGLRHAVDTRSTT